MPRRHERRSRFPDGDSGDHLHAPVGALAQRGEHHGDEGAVPGPGDRLRRLPAKREIASVYNDAAERINPGGNSRLKGIPLTWVYGATIRRQAIRFWTSAACRRGREVECQCS